MAKREKAESSPYNKVLILITTTPLIAMNLDFIIAVSSIIIALASLATSVYFSAATRRHNIKSVLPIPYLNRADFEDKLTVALVNKGSGPLIVKLVIAIHEKLGHKGPLIDIIPSKDNIFYSNFSDFRGRRALLPGEVGDMVVLDVDPKNKYLVDYHNELRRYLKDVIIEVQYTDVYGSKFEPYRIDCKWFGRKFDQDSVFVSSNARRSQHMDAD